MNRLLSQYIHRIYWFLVAQLGIDPRKTVRCLLAFPRYLFELYGFRKKCQERITIVPCLHDWNQEGGAIRNEYFWQDLIVAKRIFQDNPKKHVDIGSRLDGFVAHVASFREIEVFDIRPISTSIPGVVFKQADFMKPMSELTDYCDSLSCLHALEHFGLGRYGDPINPKGYEFGLSNFANMLQKKGKLYLSIPIGDSRVEFNANRIFDPHAIVELANDNCLHLRNILLIGNGGIIREVDPCKPEFNDVIQCPQLLAIFTFQK